MKCKFFFVGIQNHKTKQKFKLFFFVLKKNSSDKEEIIYPADVILFEGLLLFYFPELRQMFHMKIFVDTDPDTRLSRRVIRDVKERNRDLSLVLAQYLNFVKPSFEEFCLPVSVYSVFEYDPINRLIHLLID